MQQQGNLISSVFSGFCHLTYLEDIPAIVVDATPSTPPPTTRDITSAGGNVLGRTPEYSSPSPGDHYSPDLSLGDSNRTSLQRSRRTSDMSMLSTDLGNKHMSVSNIKHSLTDNPCFCRRDSSFLTDEDPNNVLSSMQNSMWGGKLSEVQLYIVICLKLFLQI